MRNWAEGFGVAIPAAIYRSAPGPGPESAPRSEFSAILGTCLGVLPKVLFECFLGPKTPKSTQKALLGALRGRCSKLLKKHSAGHFQARAPEHSCKWQPGSQVYPPLKTITYAKKLMRNYFRGDCDGFA